MTSNRHILGSLSSLGLVFDHVCSIEGCFNFLESRDQIIKTIKTQSPYMLL